MNEMYFLHDFDIDNTGTRLMYLRKAEGIDSVTKSDEMDKYLSDMIHRQYPSATKNIELISSTDDIDKWDKMLLNYHHLTANYRCATFLNCGTMISINYASVLVPFDVPVNRYESVGRHCSMNYADYCRIIIDKSKNPPLLLHQHPLVHGIACYRVFEIPYNENPDEVFFMYHYGSDYVRAVVNLNQQTVVLNHSGNTFDDQLIQNDLYNLENGMLMSLTLNREKELFNSAKQMLMHTLSAQSVPIDKDFERYLKYAEEL